MKTVSVRNFQMIPCLGIGFFMQAFSQEKHGTDGYQTTIILLCFKYSWGEFNVKEPLGSFKNPRKVVAAPAFPTTETPLYPKVKTEGLTPWTKKIETDLTKGSEKRNIKPNPPSKKKGKRPPEPFAQVENSEKPHVDTSASLSDLRPVKKYIRKRGR